MILPIIATQQFLLLWRNNYFCDATIFTYVTQQFLHYFSDAIWERKAENTNAFITKSNILFVNNLMAEDAERIGMTVHTSV